ncbi:hypothetical protein E2562_008615 [Oryza meyeriana var. granulata]|uniref:CCHC-type domain-containing protein n=1 Tax=Oryza meyeriana var. granulata TaxID=110450 RepID=A0A6G1C3S5_9ORYZ|nr:hypothetical protein E2562_008615 [Oryza meyeriana var. granulata]
MKGLADEMAVARKKLDDDDIISYILGGLDLDYNPLVASVSSKDFISLSDLYAQLLSFEARLSQQSDGGYQSTANAASRGRGQGGFGRGHGGGGPRSVCQLCGKIGHTVHTCWK